MSTTIIFGTYKIILDWFVFSKYFSDWWFSIIYGHVASLLIKGFYQNNCYQILVG